MQKGWLRMKKTVEFSCIVCPSSCRVKVTADGDRILAIEGNACKRGEEYATNEYLAPVRTITSTVRAIGYKTEVIAVRTDKPVPKDRIFQCMEEIRKVTVEAPFDIGRVVIENILGTGCNVVLSNN